MPNARLGNVRVSDARVAEEASASVGSSWKIAGDPLGTLIAEERKPKELKLTVRADKATKDNVLKPLDANAGKLDTIVRADGYYKTKDRSESGNIYYVTPPSAREELAHPRKSQHVLVKEYEQSVADQRAEEFEVTLKLVPQEHHYAEGVVIQSQTSGEWFFDMEWGSVSTGRVTQKTKAKVKNGVRVREVEVFTTPEQAEAFEQNFHRVSASRIVNVPDGKNYSADNSGDGWNTVDVTSPSGDTGFLPSGTYHIHGWKTEWISNERYRISMQFAEG